MIGLLSGVAVPLGLAMLDRGTTSGAAPPASGDGAAPETSGAVGSTGPPTSASTDDPSPGGIAAPPATFDGKTLELAEDSYADLDSGKVDELFRREADIMLRSLDLAGARIWATTPPSGWRCSPTATAALRPDRAGRGAGPF